VLTLIRQRSQNGASLLDELLEELVVVVEDGDLEGGVAGEGVGGAAEAGVVGAEGHFDLVE
jgi:hypothetical protein